MGESDTISVSISEIHAENKDLKTQYKRLLLSNSELVKFIADHDEIIKEVEKLTGETGLLDDCPAPKQQQKKSSVKVFADKTSPTKNAGPKPSKLKSTDENTDPAPATTQDAPDRQGVSVEKKPLGEADMNAQETVKQESDKTKSSVLKPVMTETVEKPPSKTLTRAERSQIVEALTADKPSKEYTETLKLKQEQQLYKEISLNEKLMKKISQLERENNKLEVKKHKVELLCDEVLAAE